MTTLSTFTALDGENLALQDWPLEDGRPARGVIVLVHGLGEYAGRYEKLAGRLNDWGFAVRGYDQYGHGDSGGVRGGLPSSNRLLEDLADVVDTTRRRMRPGLPMILMGHSMGGLVVARFVSLKMRPVEGLVMSSPALDAGMNPLQRLLVAVLPRIAPNLRLGNGLDVDALSHDPEVARAYRADPLCHDRISARLAAFIANAGPATLARAARWKVPTLLLYAGSDALVSQEGSRAFARAAPRDVLTARCFDDLFHEIFNELDCEPVYEALRIWLDARFPAKAPVS